MPTYRKERMGEAIRKVVTQKILRDHSIIPNGMVTVNNVYVSPDFSVAKIFYSTFGGDVSEKETISLMNEQRSEFRYEISKKLNLRKTPRVEFCFDKNTEYAFKIDTMLKEAE